MNLRAVDSFFRELETIGSDSLQKEAGAKDFLKAVAHNYKDAILAGGIAAGVAGGSGYLAAKRWRGKPSFFEREAKELATENEFAKMRRRHAGVKPDYKAKMDDAAKRHYLPAAAKAMAEHPGRAALDLGIIGSVTGPGIYRGIKSFRRAFGG